MFLKKLKYVIATEKRALKGYKKQIKKSFFNKKLEKKKRCKLCINPICK